MEADERKKRSSQPLPLMIMGRPNFPLWFPSLPFPGWNKANLSIFWCSRCSKIKSHPLCMKHNRKFSKAICRGRYVSAKLEHPYTPLYASDLLCSGQDLPLSITYLFHYLYHRATLKFYQESICNTGEKSKFKICNKEHLHSDHFFRWWKNTECINRLHTVLKALQT